MDLIPFYLYVNLVVLILWYHFKDRMESDLQLWGYYFSFCLVAEFAAALYSIQTHRSNHWAYNLFTTGQLIFLSTIYRKVLTSKVSLKSISIFIILYPLMVCVNLIFIQSFYKFHTLTYAMGVLFIVTLTFSYFNQLLHSEKILSLRRTPYFWFNIGNAVQFIGSIFYYCSINFINEAALDRYGELINIFAYSFTAIQYFFFIIAILCNLKRKAS